jgi:hypothetical protein
MLLEEYKEKTATSMNELESCEKHVMESEDDLSHLRKVLETLQVKAPELEGKGDGKSKRNSYSKGKQE